jgi:hypothetical protein
MTSQNYRYHAFFGDEPLRGLFKNNGQSRRAKNAALNQKLTAEPLADIFYSLSFPVCTR